ncbi:MAG TPA: P-loop NTPase fold protein, partial [Pseudonocardiaceae bacterium]|nr:P-loop NTPase fold protein [Pseudonocardiaceae bacterium]
MNANYEPAWSWSPAPDGPASPVLALALTPDQNEVGAGCGDGSVTWLGLAGRSPVRPRQPIHNDSIRTLAVTPDGLHFVSGGDDQIVRISDRLSGQEIALMPQAHSGAVWALAVTSDGREVISGGGDGTMWLWDRVTRKVRSIQTNGGAVLALTLVRDGTRIVTGSRDGWLRIWHRFSAYSEALAGHREAVLALATIGDGLLVSGGEDGTAQLWDIGRRKRVALAPIQLNDAINAVAPIPGGTRIALGGADGKIHLWDYSSSTASRIDAVLDGHEGGVRALAVTADGSLIISGGQDGTVRAWVRVTEGAEVAEPVPFPGRRHAGVHSDFESVDDKIGFTADVHAVAALLAASETPPQLSIALLGDWGSGKSSFMSQTIARVDELADRARKDPKGSPYTANIGQIRFNAWHYSDDHLWVGLIEHLMQEITYRQQEQGGQDRRESLRSELAGAREKLREGEAALGKVQRVTDEAGWVGRVNQPARVAAVFTASGRSLWRELRAPRRLLIAAGVLVACVGLIVLAARFGQPVIAWLLGVAAVAGALLAPAAAAWRRTQRIADDLVAQLMQEQRAGEAKVAELEGQLIQADPAFRFERLLSELGAPGRYEQYRGLTGKIHRDLSRLSTDLTAAQEDWLEGRSGSPPPFQRLILYIDDLDRCQPDQIVKVLQTVNLLVAMPLFVVVVAADPRWLLAALEKHHGDLFDGNRRDRALNYLDKIFQIPYAMPPMREHAADYLRGLLPAVEPQPPGATGQPDAEPRESPAPTPATTGGLPAPDPQPAQPATPAPPSDGDTDLRLHLRQAELDFLPRLAPLLATPRAVKKLTNLYRLLRAAVPDADVDGFVGDDRGGPYQAAALLLAAIVSAPDGASALLGALCRLPADDTRGIVEVLVASSDPPVARRLADQIKSIGDERPVHGPVATYRSWARVVARYGFD